MVVSENCCIFAIEIKKEIFQGKSEILKYSLLHN